jgi:hypothetical protein
MLYVPGVEEDLRQHAKACRPIQQGVLWRNNNGKKKNVGKTIVVKNNDHNHNKNDCIRLLPMDTTTTHNKNTKYEYSATLDAIFQIVTKDLGMEPILPQQQKQQRSSTITLLYLRHQRVVGVVTVEPIRRTHVQCRLNFIRRKEPV